MKRLLSLAVAAALLAGGIVGYRAVRPAEKSYSLTAFVERAPNVFAGGRVMVRGVQVGSISDVTPTPTGVRIRLEIKDSVRVPSGAHLAIVPITVISDRYVQLFPAYRRGAYMHDGDRIPMSHTAIPAELDDV